MKKVSVIAATLVILTGCASMLDSDVQTIQVVATCNGKSIPAQCSLENDKGYWEINAPGSVKINKDHSSLRVQCQSPYFRGNTVQLNSSPNSFMISNVLLGGLVGAGVDTVTGKGFNYRSIVKVAYPECR
jgi:hypothetical protein